MSSFLDIAWGKFRGWQNVCAQPQRLTAEQKRAAWQVWDLMRKTEAAAAEGDEGWAERLHAQAVELAGAMPTELRRGASVFSHWLVENREALQQQLVERSVGDAAQTTDTVSAQLIR